MRFLIGVLFGSLLLVTFLVTPTIAFNAPLLIAARRVTRKRLHPIVPKILTERTDARLSHGICPDCANEHFGTDDEG